MTAAGYESLTFPGPPETMAKQLDRASNNLQGQPTERYVLCASIEGRCWGEVVERDQVTVFEEAEGVLTRHSVEARRRAP